jgi:predicted N-acetyltransferase YhbS
MGFTEKRFGVERFNRLPEEALGEIVQASFAHWNELGVCPAKSADEWRAYLRDEDREAPRLHFGVTWNSRVVGMGSVIELETGADKKLTPWLSYLFVLPEFRGKGLPELLLGQRMMALKQLGYNEVYVKTAADNDGLHTRAGFAQVDGAPKGILRRSVRK